MESFLLIGGFILIIVLTTSTALEKCEPDRNGVLRTTVSFSSPSQIFACDVCADGQCDVDDCTTEVHILAVQNSSASGTIQVDTSELSGVTEQLKVVLVLSSETSVNWKVNLKTDVDLHHVYLIGDSSEVEFRDKNNQVRSDILVAAMHTSLDYDGKNIDSVYNEMSNMCILSFTGVEVTDKFTLYVGANVQDALSGATSNSNDTPGDNTIDSQETPEQNHDDVEKVLDLVLLVGAVVGGSIAFLCMVVCVYIALRHQNTGNILAGPSWIKAKKRRNSHDLENSHKEPGRGPLERRPSPPPRYSQAVYDGKMLPPPPTKPLPLAPGENIYAELGECKKITPENDYLEPIQNSEVNDSGKSREVDTKQYEELKEDYVDMAGYEKIHKTQLPDVQTEETEKSERKDLKRRSTTSSAKTPRNDEDEHGYLKMK